jgi:hypothetical protein
VARSTSIIGLASHPGRAGEARGAGQIRMVLLAVLFLWPEAELSPCLGIFIFHLILFPVTILCDNYLIN